MAFDPVTGIFNVAGKLIDKLLPDPAAKAKALQDMAEMQQRGDFKFLDSEVALLTGQMEINKIEAAHGGIWKGGWRPAVGWTAAAALAYNYVILPFIVSTVQIIGYYGGVQPFPIDLLPQLDMATIIGLLASLLGVGGLRTIEKLRTEKSIRG